MTPPPSWQSGHAGPGSPSGSVRPPDTTGTVAPPSRRPRSGRFLGFVLALVGAVVGSFITLGVTDQFSGQASTTPTAGSTAAPAAQAPIVINNMEDATTVSVVAAAVTPSVVRVNIAGTIGGTEQELGLGSGVIYTSDGYIITNNHVVEDAEVVTVKLSNSEEFDAEVVGTDPSSDLAVVKIDATGLPPIPQRDDPPLVGETAIAIGSPFGLDATVTAGVVSAVGRDITVPDPVSGRVEVVPAVIQTDAAINPGNSGGPLVDNQGRLLGINTAIYTESGGSQGVGFAIPEEQAFAVAEQLILTGEVEHAFLGVSGLDVTPQVADRMALPEEAGALLTEITDGSGADEAGLRVDDVIVGVDDTEITTVTDLVVAIRSQSPGDEVEIRYFRDGVEETVSIVLGEQDS
ncbi:MAG TPA: trypsin-like peptidase domain-containing protein [Nitriliruptoraceae bacterium]|nr:trypsin-like peptidase domain-containing protein [Nitriliruptoraceae bacterium]